MRVLGFAAVLLCLLVATSHAAESWLLVRPGMDVASHEAAWREACHDFVLTDNKGKENYLTCSFETGDAATANISPQGIVWWAAYQDASGRPRSEFVSRVLNELAVSGPGEACTVHDEAAECWEAEKFRVSIDTEASAGRWFVQMEDRTIFDPDAPATQ